MKLMVKWYDTTKVQYSWAELDTETLEFDTGNSAVKSPQLQHDMVITVGTQKEFKKQAQAIIKIGKELVRI